MKSISGKQLCKIGEQKGWVLQRITGIRRGLVKALVSLGWFQVYALG